MANEEQLNQITKELHATRLATDKMRLNQALKGGNQHAVDRARQTLQDTQRDIRMHNLNQHWGTATSDFGRHSQGTAPNLFGQVGNSHPTVWPVTGPYAPKNQ